MATSPASFGGHFVFINADPSDLGTNRYRKTIKGHIQSQYKPWKRRLEGRTPRRKRQPKRPSEEDKNDDTAAGQSTITSPEQKSSSANRSDVASDVSVPISDSRELVPRQRAIQLFLTDSPNDGSRTPSPFTPLQHGQSDPFNCLAIPVGATENAIISFFQEGIIPAMAEGYGMPLVGMPIVAKTYFQNVFKSLEDEGCAYASLAFLGSLRGRVKFDPNMERQVMIYRSKGFSSIKSKNRFRADFCPKKFSWQLFMLRNAETVAGSYRLSELYGSLLAKIVDAGIVDSDLSLLNYILHSTVTASVKFLTRTSFDMDHWESHRLTSLWTMAKKSVAGHLGETPFVDPSVLSPEVRKILVERKQTEALLHLQASSSIQLSQAASVWIVTQNFIHQGRLVNHYADLQDKIARSQSTNSPPTQLEQMRIQAALALATLLTCKEGMGYEAIEGIEVTGVMQNLLLHLRKALTATDGDTIWNLGPDAAAAAAGARPSSTPSFRNPRLWALYVGAQIEHKIATRTDVTTTAHSWFNITFAAFARSHSLFSWPDICSILQGFYFDDEVKPHPSEWFYKAMSALIERDGISIPMKFMHRGDR